MDKGARASTRVFDSSLRTRYIQALFRPFEPRSSLVQAMCKPYSSHLHSIFDSQTQVLAYLKPASMHPDAIALTAPAAVGLCRWVHWAAELWGPLRPARRASDAAQRTDGVAAPPRPRVPRRASLAPGDPSARRARHGAASGMVSAASSEQRRGSLDAGSEQLAGHAARRGAGQPGGRPKAARGVSNAWQRPAAAEKENRSPLNATERAAEPLWRPPSSAAARLPRTAPLSRPAWHCHLTAS